MSGCKWGPEPTRLYGSKVPLSKISDHPQDEGARWSFDFHDGTGFWLQQKDGFIGAGHSTSSHDYSIKWIFTITVPTLPNAKGWIDFSKPTRQRLYLYYDSALVNQYACHETIPIPQFLKGDTRPVMYSVVAQKYH